MDNEIILSAGIDIGTTTTHLIISKIGICVTGGFAVVPQAEITSKEIIYKSPVYFTPLNDNSSINAKKTAEIISTEYKKAGVKPQDLKSGAVIITGESANKRNSEQVLHAISKLAGSFVAAQAGTQLESYLAGMGSGADKISSDTGMITANVDIGGGTTNISVFDNGECIDDCCLNIGGRLVKELNDGTISFSPTVENICRKKNIVITDFTDEKSISNVKKLCEIMADIIAEALGFGYMTEFHDMCVADHSLTCGQRPQIVTFSGGVAQCMNEEHTIFEFGDIGVLLADAVKKSADKYPCKVIYENENPIRATVIGAGNFSMEISGSTIQYSDISLPIKNVRCVCELSQIGDELCAVCPKTVSSPSFEYVNNLAAEIYRSSKRLIENNLPLIVLIKYDFSKALGMCLKQLLPKNYPFICADSIVCKNGDYIDIGQPVANGKAVPVVVKTLVFGGMSNEAID